MQAGCWTQMIVFLDVKICKGPHYDFQNPLPKSVVGNRHWLLLSASALPATRSLGPSLCPAHDTMINASVVAWNHQKALVNFCNFCRFKLNSNHLPELQIPRRDCKVGGPSEASLFRQSWSKREVSISKMEDRIYLSLQDTRQLYAPYTETYFCQMWWIKNRI